MLKVIAAIAVIVLINLRELLQAEQRGKVMGIYFTVMGVSLALGILISIDKQPSSVMELLMNLGKSLGLGEV